MANNLTNVTDYMWLEKQTPLVQTFFGTLFTWGMTAVGAAMIYVLPVKSKQTTNILDGSLGFAAGVMIAASFWSLLIPGLEYAGESIKNEPNGGTLLQKLGAVCPVAIGFIIGAFFCSFAGDIPLKYLQKGNPDEDKTSPEETDANKISLTEAGLNVENKNTESDNIVDEEKNKKSQQSFQRMVALILAITLHNIPEGMTVGVAFGAKGNFNNAVTLAIGIGIQNFPEGLAVSLPLAASGHSKFKSFLWGQCSGLVEPIFGLLGCIFVTSATFLLPYGLGFAAGAMIFVVMDDIIPDACSRNNENLASKLSVFGFIVMMILEVVLA